MDFSKNLTDDEFKFALAFLERNHKELDLTSLKLAYIKSRTISTDGTMAYEEVIQAG